jgi:hypothetical protein
LTRPLSTNLQTDHKRILFEMNDLAILEQEEIILSALSRCHYAADISHPPYKYVMEYDLWSFDCSHNILIIILLAILIFGKSHYKQNSEQIIFCSVLFQFYVFISNIYGY